MIRSSISLNDILGCLQIIDSTIQEKLFKYFSSSLLAPLFSVPRAMENDMSIKKLLQSYYSNIDPNIIDQIKGDSHFKFFNRAEDQESLTKAAKEWYLIKTLEKIIPSKRLEILSNQNSIIRPRPYNHAALEDLNITEDYLVNLNNFEIEGSALIRNEYAFTLCPITESPNSSFWILNVLVELSKSHEVYVRLDPFINAPRTEFVNPQFKMWVHGIKNLDWQRITNLRNEEFGEWMPDNIESCIDKTQYVWSPRSEEVHFICEELPKISSSETRGSRYFHSILDKSNDIIIHLDGALRIYRRDDLGTRVKSHIKDTGKVGTRIKLFRIDDGISREVLSRICTNFYVWNNDVIQYFS